MNHRLSERQIDAILEVLFEGLIAIRVAARAGDTGKCEVVSDALHNLPDLLRCGDQRGWTLDKFVHIFLKPLAGTYREITGWAWTLRRAQPRGRRVTRGATGPLSASWKRRR